MNGRSHAPERDSLEFPVDIYHGIRYEVKI